LSLHFLNLNCLLKGRQKLSKNSTILFSPFDSLHFGQFLPCVLLPMLASHSCPFLHCHQTFLFDPGVTSFGVSLLFLVGCHCAAISGRLVSKQFSKQASFPEHFLQPLPLTRPAMTAGHSCPFSHIHQTFLCEKAVTSFGVSLLFLVGCHCAAISGRLVSKQLSKQGFCPEQYGQPLPLTLSPMAASHSCSFSHIHQTFLPDPEVTSFGVRSPFSVGCHSFASSG